LPTIQVTKQNIYPVKLEWQALQPINNGVVGVEPLQGRCGEASSFIGVVGACPYSLVLLKKDVVSLAPPATCSSYL